MKKLIQWQCAQFDELSGKQVYAILKARSEVFVREQNCVYLDMDDNDASILHVVAWAGESQVAAYLRIHPPGTRYSEPCLGRVLSTKAHRGTGIGRKLMLEGIKQIEIHYPMQAIRINAQAYLKEFYRSFGFDIVSEDYMEDGIPHVEMLRPASGRTQPSKTSDEI